MDTESHEASLQKIQDALGKTEHLPPTPEILIALLRVIDDPDVSVDEIGEIVRADAPLSLSLLRLVNSAAYGLVREVTDTAEAVRYVGSTEVKNLSVAIAVKTGLIGRAPVCNSFERKAVWKNFMASGLGAHITATLRGLASKKTAFSAGLLHQVGLVLLDTVLPYKLQFAISEVAGGGKTLLGTEREVIGFTHGEVGVWLGEKWEIPRPLLEPMIYCEKPWGAPRNPELAAVVQIGDRLAWELAPLYEAPSYPPIDARTLGIVNIEAEFLDRVRRDLRRELDRLSPLLEMS